MSRRLLAHIRYHWTWYALTALAIFDGFATYRLLIGDPLI